MSIEVRDYLERLRPAEIREEFKKSGGAWFYIYSLSVIPMFVLTNIDENPQAVLRYYLMIGALLFPFLSARMHGMCLPKIMYLCPMSHEERRTYLSRSWRVRIVLDLGVAAVPILLAYVFGVVDLENVGSAALSVLFLVFSGSVRKLFELNENGLMVFGYNNAGGFCAQLLCILSYGTGIFSLTLDMGGADGRVAFCIFLGIELLIELPLTVRVLRGRDAAIEEALDYESAYRIARRRV